MTETELVFRPRLHKNWPSYLTILVLLFTIMSFLYIFLIVFKIFIFGLCSEALCCNYSRVWSIFDFNDQNRRTQFYSDLSENEMDEKVKQLPLDVGRVDYL